MGAGDTEVRRVAADVTAPLRAEVLRPGQGAAAVVKPDDDEPDTAFFAVIARGGRVLSTANVRPRRPAWDPVGDGWWQLRGMATIADARGRGHGAAVLRAALEHVDGGRVWCNARTRALGLYTRSGFEAVGDPWTHPERGPHPALRRPRPG